MTKTVALAGLGAIGYPLARALDDGVEGLRLVAVATRDLVKARARLVGFRETPALVDFPDLAEADIVVEATPAALFERSRPRRSKPGGFSSPRRLARCCPECIW